MATIKLSQALLSTASDEDLLSEVADRGLLDRPQTDYFRDYCLDFLLAANKLREIGEYSMAFKLDEVRQIFEEEKTR